MQRKSPTLFTQLFLLALSVLFSAFVASFLVWGHGTMARPIWPFFEWSVSPYLYLAAAYVLSFVCLIFYIIIRQKKVTYERKAVWMALILFWISAVLLFITLFEISIIAADWMSISYLKPGPLIMVFMTIVIFFAYLGIERILLSLSGRCPRLSFFRLLLFHRFSLLGDFIIWLEDGWRAVAIRFIDVFLAVWLVQSVSRVFWQTTRLKSFSSWNYSEIIQLPNNSSNGSIFDAFGISGQINYSPLSFKGEDFAPDMISSISSLLWHHWHEIVVLWFLLEVFFIIYSSSRRLVFVDISRVNAPKDKEDYQPAGSNLTNLLATKLDRINHIYRIVDEKRPIQSACGAGEPIEAAIKVGNLDDVSLSSIPDLSLGPVKIPIQSISNILSHILGSPKIILDLHHRTENRISVDKENHDSPKEKTSHSGKKSEWFLTASMSGREGLRTWLVDSPDSLEGDEGERARSVEDIVTEMAHRIYTSLQADATGESINWRAMWKFNEGLRAYRDCLNTTRKHKYYLSMAEKSLMDAIEEQNSFSLAYYNLGVVYAELNKLNASESCFQKAVSFDPQLWEAYYAQGIASYRQGKELDDLHDYLDLDIKEGAKKQIEGEYKKAIQLCQRVLDIKSDQEGLIDKDFSMRAKVFDLEGNARARLACIKCKKGSICDACNQVDPEELKRAISSLENSVHNSWMALIKESVLNETVEDESKIVSECSQDLAYLYLKMHRCLSPRKATLLSNAFSVLRQAIYINPDDANLCHLLGRVSKRMDQGHYFTEKIYNYALRIKPESSRFKANLLSVKSDKNDHHNKGPSFWLETCENSGCMDEEIHESFFHLLARAMEEEDNAMKIDPTLCECLSVLCERQKRELDLKRVSGKGERAISLLQQKKCDCQRERDPELSLVLLRLARDFDDIYADCRCLPNGLYMLEKSEIFATTRENAEQVLLANEANEVERLELADYFFRLGQISFEFGRARAEAETQMYAQRQEISRKEIPWVMSYITLK